jgi:NTP pyrophosphatase (non-canonical NTP hydrolase)
MKPADRLEQVGEAVRAFVVERDWEQFHSPKNLAMALSVEAAELQEIFQWLSEAKSRKLSRQQLQAARDELADVFIYVLRMSQVLKIDLLAAVSAKVEKNRQKYPVEKSRGSVKKYDRL